MAQNPMSRHTPWIDDDDFLTFMRDMDWDTEKAEALLDSLLAKHQPPEPSSTQEEAA